jgi:quinoprotein glucose dehydrogenase
MVLIHFVITLLASTPESAFELMQVPEGFSKQLIATEPQVMDPVAFCFDDDGNILVAESFRQEKGVEDNRSSSFWLDWDLGLQSVENRLKMYVHFADQRKNGMDYYSEFEDRIRLLQDLNEDGIFETATIFADGFNDPLDGTGAGVLAIGDVVYYTCIPHVWVFKNGKKKSLFQGFGVRIALRGHDMHGLALGLDGRLYWSIGDRGYHIELDDGTEFHSPGEGAVFRCELDGTKLEMFHHGLRNPQELAFDKYGNLFTGDNNSDASDKARLVYCVEGGETGWRMEYQTLEGVNERGPWVTENGWDPHAKDRPSWILPAIDVIGSGPSGLVAYPGAGFPERYDNHFFMCDFQGGAEHSNVLSFAIEPDGAHFKMVDLHPFAEKVLCTDVDFGYDGKMVISDWGEGWTGNEEGRLYSVWDEEHFKEGDVSDIFSKGFKQVTNHELIQMLSHVDRRVRIRAQYELVRRNAINELKAVLKTGNQIEKIHAMWATAMMSRQGQKYTEYIAYLLNDQDSEIRAQACKILGETGVEKRIADRTFELLLELIDDPDPRVSYFATIATGHLGNAFDAIISMLERNNNEDVYLRHAGVVALTNSQYASTIANLQTNPNASVRLAAVLVLRRMKSVFIADYLNDSDDTVATEAARAIHDARIYGVGFEDVAMTTLAKSLHIARTIPWQKRALSANKMEQDSDASVRVALFAADEKKPEPMRILAVQSLRNWKPDYVNRDIVEGRVIPSKHMSAISMGDIDEPLERLLKNAKGELLMEVLRFVYESGRILPTNLCSELVYDENVPINIRVYALQKRGTVELLNYALKSDFWQLRAAARGIMLKQKKPNAVIELLNTVYEGEIFEAQEAIKSLATDNLEFERIDRNKLRQELQLEYAEAKKLEIDNDCLLSGGNPLIGKKIVFENSRSECLRCHKINDHGGIAGPSLDGIGSKLNQNQILESLIEPSSEISEGFGEYSAMPPMNVLLSKRELRDVVSYLKTLQ